MNTEEKIASLEERISVLENEVAQLKGISGEATNVKEDYLTPAVEQITPLVPIVEEKVLSNRVETVAKPASEPEKNITVAEQAGAANKTVASAQTYVPVDTGVAVSGKKNINVASSYTERMAAIAAQRAEKTQTPQSSSAPATPSDGANRYIPPKTGPVNVPPVRKTDDGLENRIGKNVMGIAASVLIFFSIILFGVLIYDVIGDAFKVAIMFTISIVLTAVGIVKMRSEKYRVFFTTLAACGTGALYISFMLTYFSFSMISLTVLVIALSVWTLFVAILSKMASPIFMYICYAGLVVSTLLCAVKWNESPASLIFYLASIIVLFALNMKKHYRQNAFFFIQFPIMLGILSIIYSSNIILLIVIMFAVFAALILQNMFFDFDKAGESILIPVTVLTYITLAIGMKCMSDMDLPILDYVFSVIFIAITVVYYFTHGKDKENKTAYIVSYYLTAAFLVIFFAENIWILAPILFAIGFIRDDKQFRYVSYAYVTISALMAGSLSLTSWVGDSGNIALLVLLAIIIVMGVMMLNPRRYDIVDKYVITGMTFLTVALFAKNEVIGFSVMFVIMSLLSIGMNTGWYKKNPQNKNTEDSTVITGYAVNAILMILGLALIRVDHSCLKIIEELPGTEIINTALIILFSIGVFAVNTTELFKLKMPELTVGIYLCAKFTVLIFCILTRFDAVGYIKSIVGLVIAVCAIALGFYFKHKSFRLYGLVLALICVVKLIIIDIDYGSSLLRPVGYLGAGILCFIISWIYTRLEKRDNVVEKVEEQ